MANKPQPDDTQTNPNLSVWNIPVKELPDKASEVWGRCPDKRQGNVATGSPAHPKGKQIEPHRRSTDERAAASI